jgi:WD40 repeat protein
VWQASFTPDGRYVLTTSVEKNGQGKYEIRNWDTATGREAGPPLLFDVPVVVIPGQEGRRLVVLAITNPSAKITKVKGSGGLPGLMNVNITTAQFDAHVLEAARREPVGPPLKTFDLLFSIVAPGPGLHRMVTVSENGLRSWDPVKAQWVGELLPLKDWKRVKPSPSGWFPGDPQSGNVLVLEAGAVTALGDGGERATSWNWPGNESAEVQFSPDGRFALASESRTHPEGEEFRARVWDWQHGRPLKPFLALPGRAEVGWSFTSDGRRMSARATRAGRKEAYLWDWVVPEPVHHLPTGRAPFDAFWLSPDGLRVALLLKPDMGKPTTIQVYKVGSNQPVSPPLEREGGFGLDDLVQFSPDGRYLLTTTSKAKTTLRVWEVASGKPLGPAWEMVDCLFQGGALTDCPIRVG